MSSKNDRYAVETPRQPIPEDAAEKVFTQPGLIPRKGKTVTELQKEIDDLKTQLETSSGGIVPMAQDGTLLLQGFHVSPTSLTPMEEAEITPEQWEQVGLLLFKIEGSIQWLIGDWLVWGQDWEYGDVVVIAKHLGRDVQYLYDLRYVARHVQSSYRNEHLSFTHHIAVAKLKTDDKKSYALSYALEKGLSVQEFRKWIRKGMPDEKPDKEQHEEQKEQPFSRKAANLISGVEKVLSTDLAKIKDEDIEPKLGEIKELRDWLSDVEKKLKRLLEKKRSAV